METILLRPVRSNVQYQGVFGDINFELLASPIPLYRNLLKRLGKYGVTLQNLKVDFSTLGEANVNCTLLELSTNIAIRLDRIEINWFFGTFRDALSL